MEHVAYIIEAVFGLIVILVGVAFIFDTRRLNYMKRLSDQEHKERMAMILNGVAPPASAPFRDSCKSSTFTECAEHDQTDT